MGSQLAIPSACCEPTPDFLGQADTSAETASNRVPGRCMYTEGDGPEATQSLSIPPDCCGAQPLFMISTEERGDEAAFTHYRDEYKTDQAEHAPSSYHRSAERSTERDSRTDYIINLVQSHKVTFQKTHPPWLRLQPTE
jgi:hypothetical protein